MNEQFPDNPLLLAEKDRKVLSPEETIFRDKIVDWLCEYPWLLTWMVTYRKMEERRTQQNYTGRAGYVPGLNFKGKPHGWTGGNHWKGKPELVGISERNTKRYFERHMRKHYTEWSWFYCVEPNPTRDGHHLHALMIPPAGAKFSFKQMGKLWWNQYGYNEFQNIRSKKDISGYCTKHIVRYLNKGGGWYNLEINDSDIYHGRKRKTRERVKGS